MPGEFSRLLKQILHLFKERFFLRGFLVVPEFREFLVEFLLFAAKVLRDFHADVHVEASTVAALVQRVQALFAQAQDAPGLGSGRNLDLHFATVQRRDSLRTAGILMEISSVSCTRPRRGNGYTDSR